VFRRDDIVTETDLAEAAAKPDAMNRDSSVTVAAQKSAERLTREANFLRKIGGAARI
jgi:hypothetical protein